MRRLLCISNGGACAFSIVASGYRSQNTRTTARPPPFAPGQARYQVKDRDNENMTDLNLFLPGQAQPLERGHHWKTSSKENVVKFAYGASRILFSRSSRATAKDMVSGYPM